MAIEHYIKTVLRFGDEEEKEAMIHCPICKKPVGDFRDAISRQEYQISGLCQSCQDAEFGPGGV